MNQDRAEVKVHQAPDGTVEQFEVLPPPDDAGRRQLEAGRTYWVATSPLRNLQRQSRERQRLRARIDREGVKHAPGSTKPWRDEAKIRSKKTAAKKARRKNR